MTRRSRTAASFEEIIATTAELVDHSPNAQALEIRFDITNRKAGDDEAALATDTVRWTAAADLIGPLGVTRVTGTALVEPGGRQAIGISYACVRLLQALGVNTVVVDAYSEVEPPR